MQPLLQWVQRGLSSGLKQLVREAGNSPPSSSEVNSGGAKPLFRYMPSWFDAKYSYEVKYQYERDCMRLNICEVFMGDGVQRRIDASFHYT
jgi:hypothetical protein